MVTAEPARVLRLITRLNIGGPARQALLLSRALADDYPTVLAAGTPPAEEGELSDAEVPVHRVPLVRPLHPRHDARALLAVRRLIRSSGAVLVHTHMAKAGTVGRLAAATVRPRPLTVHTFHGHVLDGYFSPAVQRGFVAAEQALARHTDVLVAISTEIRDQLLELGIGLPSQYRVIPLGLDLSRHLAVEGRSGALREHLRLAPDVPLVGVLGRLAPIKDHDTLLQAMAGVPGAHLAVLGDGELRGDLERRARELGIEGRTHFTGWWDDVPAAIADLDVVALSSRNEGTPVSLIEAAACGRPCAATNVGGVRSVVEHGRSGLLVPPGDPSSLADAVTRLLRDPRLRAHMGREARVGASRFAPGRLVRDIRELYDELTGR